MARNDDGSNGVNPEAWSLEALEDRIEMEALSIFPDESECTSKCKDAD